MAKRKINKDEAKNQPLADNVHIKGAGSVQDEVITNTLTDNFMPYAMSIILSRAIPQIDGFKPSHRKLLYTMYNMGLLQSGTIKSANIVGRTMQLNPHGDAAIYETMIRLSRGNETLLYPYVESKGNFGKAYSKNMVYAASRYTEAKLAPICHELFDDIKSDTVDFVDNYDNTMKEPTLLPVTFPSILCNVTTGIAAGMASSIASFNLKEICDTTIALMKNPDHEVSDTLLAPDFVGGGYILYDKEEFEKSEVETMMDDVEKSAIIYEMNNINQKVLNEISTYANNRERIQNLTDEFTEILKAAEEIEPKKLKYMSHIYGLGTASIKEAVIASITPIPGTDNYSEKVEGKVINLFISSRGEIDAKELYNESFEIPQIIKKIRREMRAADKEDLYVKLAVTFLEMGMAIYFDWIEENEAGNIVRVYEIGRAHV